MGPGRGADHPPPSKTEVKRAGFRFCYGVPSPFNDSEKGFYPNISSLSCKPFYCIHYLSITLGRWICYKCPNYLLISMTYIKDKGKFHTIQATKCLEVSRGIALLILDLGARRGGWSAPRPGRFTPRKDSVSIVREAGWASGPVLTCAKNFPNTRIQSRYRPACRQSLYRLTYRAHMTYISITLHSVWRKSILYYWHLLQRRHVSAFSNRHLQAFYWTNSVLECYASWMSIIKNWVMLDRILCNVYVCHVHNTVDGCYQNYNIISALLRNC
jgi:hypothetical protein